MLPAFALLCVLGIGWGGFSLSSFWQLRQIPGMSFEEGLLYTTRGNQKARISVGIIQDGKMEYTVYGADGTILPQVEHVYEIGSLTKTFTASLLAKAVLAGDASLDDPFTAYLPLTDARYTPSLRQLTSHTAGYKNYYFAKKMIINFLAREANDFFGITSQTLREQLEEVELEDKIYPFHYSNFGYAALGEVLEEMYGENYRPLMDRFVKEELLLTSTHISDGRGDLEGYWNWGVNDAYLSAGGLLSTITDMLVYCRIQMEGSLPYLSLTQELIAEVPSPPAIYEQLGIGIDAVGMGWMWDEDTGVYWHNGGTSRFNSYLAFDRKRQIGVVVLSNLPPSRRIPATVLGAKLMEELQRKASH